MFALATGAGRAAIAVVRLSGPAVGGALDALCGGRRPAARRASVRALRDPAGGASGGARAAASVMDRALVLWFPGPDSYTGEDAAELHLHAGPAVIEAVSGALVTLGLRPAEPGEFTRRAFLHGRLDLLEAEGIADLVAAETEAQRRQALAQADGALSRLHAGWGERLRRALAFQEALIDFPDEDLPAEVEAELLADLRGLLAELRTHLAAAEGARLVRDGVFVALVGAPNAGKSSLLNRLAGRDAAIVTPVAGTTRDAIEVRMVLDGVAVTLVDTAGLRDSDDPVEAEGVRRARQRAAEADLVLLVGAPDVGVAEGVAPERAVRVWNKADLAAAPAGDWLAVSAVSGAGMAGLERRLAAEVGRLTAAASGPPPTRARHRAGIAEAAVAIEEALRAPWPELRGESLRLAMRALGRLSGAVGVEDLLDTVFSSFCIGK